MSIFRSIQRAVPVISIALCIGLYAAFYIFQAQDNERIQQVLSQYDQQALLVDEQPLYLDFIQRRLRVEQIGSPEYLVQLEKAIQLKDATKVAWMILSDRFFYPYLKKDGRLFMAPAVFRSWQDRRDQFITPTMDSLSARQFGLTPEKFGASNLVTHVVVEPEIMRLMANIILLMLLGLYLEPKTGKGKMLLLFAAGGITSSGCYELLVMLFDNQNEVVFQSATGAVLGVSGMVLASLLSAKNKIMKFLLLFVFTVLLVGRMGFEGWLGLIGWKLAIAYAFVFLTGFALHLIFRHSIIGDTQDDSLEDYRGQSREFRVELAKVLDAISTLDFAVAREKLTELSERYPDAIELVEQRYHLEKLQPEGEVYWECARELVDFSVKNKDYFRMKTLFEDIQKNAASKKHAKARLAPEYYHKMMMVFVKHDDLNKAEQAYMFLELAGHSNIIKDACLLLKQEFKTRGVIAKAQQYQMLLERL